MTWEWTPASVIALYAAIVSTITVAWNIRNALRDAPHVKLDLRFRRVVQNERTGELLAVDDVDDLKGTHLALTITNTGRRPITVMQWGGTHRKPQPGGRYFISRALISP